MRITAGSARGRTLQGPKSQEEIRPTSDKVRQALFNILGQWFEGGEVLDLFAGTGALALEALSRGASRAVLVDQGKEAQTLCRANAQALGFGGQVEVVAMSVERALAHLAGRAFDLVFADPPYALRAVPRTVDALALGRLVKGTLCIEHDRREQAPVEAGALKRTDERRFGDTVLTFYAAA